MNIIYGSDNSPYSVKVRSYVRYKGIPHDWRLRSRYSDEYQKIARIPIVPAVKLADGKGMQDSTPIMKYFDEKYEDTISTHPKDPCLRFLSYLLEEFGDEWANKWMFHFRWARPVDQRIVALRLANEFVDPNTEDFEDTLVQMSQMIRLRMSGRAFAVASNDVTGPMIERSFRDGVSLLEEHLKTRQYLFGSRPSFGGELFFWHGLPFLHL